MLGFFAKRKFSKNQAESNKLIFPGQGDAFKGPDLA